MRITVLGASGMAGHVISIYFKERGYDVRTFASKNKIFPDTKLIDVMNERNLLEELLSRNDDAIINCIGVLVKESEFSKDKASYINAYFPRMLEQNYSNTSTRIIHISTDAVFSGSKKQYIEDDLYDGQSFYGRSKALGEINNEKDITVRTSIIGPELSQYGQSFFNWIYTQVNEINGYSNVFWKGLTTPVLASAIEAIILQNVRGLHHLIPDEQISKLELIENISTTFGLNQKINPILGSGYNTNLINTREELIFKIPNYKEMIEAMKYWINQHPSIYPHYNNKP